MPSRIGILRFSVFAVALLLSSVAFGTAVLANAAHQFGGTYRIVEVKNQGENVQVRLALRLRNYSAADVKGATVSFESSLPSGAKQVAAEGVSLRVNEREALPALETTLTISAREYAGWKNGARPSFFIDFEDSTGTHNHQAIELIRMP
jgi:hypothetical protein